ncbi:uncharacterized protein LOC118153659 [Callithrix jacchus]|uniref:uncharacterized protein LOC118153659 n=1 Tax=Callithrix jacchus TaxID=9483 RepID=UPI00159E3BFD|nr:uncharacterized protein LOC118153659 [Callithrix jacchus]
MVATRAVARGWLSLSENAGAATNARHNGRRRRHGGRAQSPPIAPRASAVLTEERAEPQHRLLAEASRPSETSWTDPDTGSRACSRGEENTDSACSSTRRPSPAPELEV